MIPSHKVQLNDEASVSNSVILLHDRMTIPSARILRDSGEMIAPVTLARCGIMLYKAKELGAIAAHLPPEKVCRVRTRPEVLFDQATIDSCRSIPLTVTHPKDDVDISNNKELQKGFLEGLPSADGTHLVGHVVINDGATIKLVDAGYDQVSLGATCELEVCTDGEADFDKVSIKANHFAIVRNARAQTTRIGDSGEEIGIVDRTVYEALEAERDALKDKTVTLEQRLVDAESVRLTDEQIQTMVEERVESRMNMLTNIARLGDGYVDMDFSGQTDSQIRRTVVAKLLDADVSSKSDAYIEARFEVALEDAGSVTLSDALSISMQHTSKEGVVERKPSPRDEALQRRKERYNK